MSTIVITGANRGLGLELARAFAARGDTVIAACRNPDTAHELRTVTDRVLALDAGLDARGLGADPAKRGALAIEPEHFMGQIRVNTLGPMLLARALVPNLEAAGNGRIVNVSSQVGSMEVGQRMGSDVGYAASKAALNMVTIKLAAALRERGITAIMLHPGYLRTEMGGAGADLEPADAAASIVTLIDGLTIDDTMTFRRWDGTVHPW